MAVCNNALYAILVTNDGRTLDTMIHEFLGRPLSEPAHVTVLYGPPQSATDAEPTPQEIAAMYAPTIAWCMLSEAGLLKGVGIFCRPHNGRFIVHLQVHYPDLSTLRAELLRKYPSAMHTLQTQHSELCDACKKFPDAYDTSFTIEPDAPWAHITLCTVDTKEAAVDIAAKAREFFHALIGTIVRVQHFVGVSAVTDTYTVIN